MSKMKLLVTATACCGALIVGAASAAPIAPITAATPANVQNVRWVCGPYRCWWQPNYYGYYGYGPYGYPGYWGGYPVSYAPGPRGYPGYAAPYGAPVQPQAISRGQK